MVVVLGRWRTPGGPLRRHGGRITEANSTFGPNWRSQNPYPSSFSAITTRWIWLVPS